MVSLYMVGHWGHPADLWYSAAPLELDDDSYEPKLHPLPLSVEGVNGPDCFNIRAESRTLVFRVENAEHHLELP